jgi:starch synthase
MRILLASSEVYPYSKTGGLADMAGSLAKALSHIGHQVTLVTPLYSGVIDRFLDIKRVRWDMRLAVGSKMVEGELWERQTDDGVRMLFVGQGDYFLRPALYSANGVDYEDNAERFVFFSKAVVHLARYLPGHIDVLHVHDWQSALAPLFLQHQELEGWGNPPVTCLTIHNLAYQGVFPAAAFGLTNLPAHYLSPSIGEFYGAFSFLKAGLAVSDVLTTVSPRYAREITTEEFGCALDGLLRHRQNVLTGILNGVDYDEWNTGSNPHLAAAYSSDDLTGKAQNKAALQQKMGLPVESDVPLFASITRLVEQKGVDLALGAVQEMLGQGMQFALLGSGQPRLERAFETLATRHPERAAVRIGYDAGLSHLIEAGADFFLMPSRFEPCGLNQMYSLRYGTIPIVRATGGLDDSVTDISESTEGVNGIKFRQPSTKVVAHSIRKALALYREPELLSFYRHNGMTADFSWDRSAREYVTVFEGAVHRRQELKSKSVA